MRHIEIERPKEYFNQNCSYDIKVGNRILAKLKNGEKKTIEIPAELQNTTIQAKIQWCGSKKFDLSKFSENEKIIISGNKLLNKKLPLLSAIIPLFGVLIFTNNKSIFFKNMGIAFLLLFIIALISLLTVYRNNWLKLTTEK
jgi:hypothetical protein